MSSPRPFRPLIRTSMFTIPVILFLIRTSMFTISVILFLMCLKKNPIPFRVLTPAIEAFLFDSISDSEIMETVTSDSGSD